MKHPIILSVCAGLVVGSVLGSAAWAERAIQVPAVTYGFESIAENGACGTSEVLEVGTQGNKTFLKLHNVGEMVSEDTRLTGDVIVDVDVFINNVNGHINAHGSFVLTPIAHVGTWEGDFNIQVPGGKSIDVNGIMIVKDSRMNARGTGDFEGQWFFFEHGFPVTDPPYESPVDAPLGCEFLGEIWAGTIFDPNAT